MQPALGTALFLASEKLCVTGRQTAFDKNAKLVVYYYYYYIFKHSNNYLNGYQGSVKVARSREPNEESSRLPGRRQGEAELAEG